MFDDDYRLFYGFATIRWSINHPSLDSLTVYLCVENDLLFIHENVYFASVVDTDEFLASLQKFAMVKLYR